MASPCVDESETVSLEVDGAPGVLVAKAHDVSGTWSATQGDGSLHVVTDAAVPHVQTQTANVANPLTENPVTGIVIAAFAPIVLGPGILASEFIWSAELLINGIVQDSNSGNVNLAAAADFTETDTFLCVIPSLLGQIDIVAGGHTAVIFRKTVENNGPSTQWSFIMNGDKMVAHFGP